MTRGIPELTNLGEGDLELNISHIGFVEGYPEWEDDVKKARRGKRVYREIQNREMRLLVEILPYGFSTEIKGYVVLIQKMD